MDSPCNVYVHPSFPLEDFKDGKAWSYLDELLASVDGRCYIVTVGREYDRALATGRKLMLPLESLGTNIDGKIFPSGWVVPGLLDELTALAAQEWITFHGAYFGRCVANFITQLTFIRKYGLYLPSEITGREGLGVRLYGKEVWQMRALMFTSLPPGWKVGSCCSKDMGDLIWASMQDGLGRRFTTSETRIHLMRFDGARDGLLLRLAKLSGLVGNAEIVVPSEFDGL
ncbi:MAG: hypothetical protein ABIG95_06535 [Candidatus Woesearchaeota archaeon]